eukprot:GSChrysophyteH1.ASY1.ANO1.1061.1 assembled CDS
MVRVLTLESSYQKLEKQLPLLLLSMIITKTTMLMEILFALELRKPLPLRSKDEAMEQWNWLEAKMKGSQADYLLVAGHFPVYSVCNHGNTDTLIQHLKPLLEQYDAHYLSGHDHCMVHLQEEGKKVNYVLSGMGDTCCYKANKKDGVPEGSLKWFLAKENHGHIFDHDVTGGFTSFQADKQSLSIAYYDQHGNTLFNADPVAPRAVQ